MGSSGDKPRKPRHRLARVSKYPDSSGNPLAGLTGGGESTAPGESHGPSEHHHPIGRVGSAFLWLLGRRRTPMPPASEPVASQEHKHEHEHEAKDERDSGS
jgi:hypothetical protein